jgi:hypothetical protein
MAKKETKNSIIQDAQPVNEQAYVTWGDDLSSKQEALKTSSESLDEYTVVQRAQAGRFYRVDYSNLDGRTGSRPGLTRSDYDFFRPDEAVPKRIKDIIRRADEIYQKVGLVKNVIDLMGDFAVQGIRICHKNKKVERFYRQWFKKINGKERSERFLNNLYKAGNVVINRQTGKLSLKTTEKLYRAVASPDLQVSDLDNSEVEKREIPWKYTFIDPTFVEVAAGPLSSFVTDKKYELELPAILRKIINSPKSDAEKEVIQNLPQQIIEASKTKRPYPLDPNKTLVFHYKKDDWQAWAFPMVYSIMDDITVIEKLKLADMAALDGAISNIRIFKLGSLEHKIAPTRAATAKLAQILGNNVGGGTMDLVWGPDIELIESKTAVHQFLGEGKYIPHMNNVYAGLGIPPTLTGTFGAAGTTNNFISLKTLTQRLMYGRDILIAFWEKEIELVQKAMNFKYGAKIEFDRMDLSNEDAEKALLIQLADRSIISDELLQVKFGIDPDMEKSRLNRELRERDSNRMVPKAGPWNDPQVENALKKIALQTGIVTPSQVGLELEKKRSGEKTAMEQKISPIGTSTKLANDSPESLPGVPGQGRPKLSKDSQQRKSKKFTPQTGAHLMLWANEAQDKISELINPILLDFYNKRNLRSLSKSEAKEMDIVKTKLLLSLQPFCTIDHSCISKIFANIQSPDYLTIINSYNNWLKPIKSHINRDLTVDEIKQLKSSFYSMVYNSLLTNQ